MAYLLVLIMSEKFSYGSCMLLLENPCTFPISRTAYKVYYISYYITIKILMQYLNNLMFSGCLRCTSKHLQSTLRPQNVKMFNFLHSYKDCYVEN